MQPRQVPRLFCELGKERVVEGANPYRRTVFAFDLLCIGLRNPTFQPVGGDVKGARPLGAKNYFVLRTMLRDQNMPNTENSALLIILNQK